MPFFLFPEQGSSRAGLLHNSCKSTVTLLLSSCWVFSPSGKNTVQTKLQEAHREQKYALILWMGLVKYINTTYIHNIWFVLRSVAELIATKKAVNWNHKIHELKMYSLIICISSLVPRGDILNLFCSTKLIHSQLKPVNLIMGFLIKCRTDCFVGFRTHETGLCKSIFKFYGTYQIHSRDGYRKQRLPFTKDYGLCLCTINAKGSLVPHFVIVVSLNIASRVCYC